MPPKRKLHKVLFHLQLGGWTGEAVHLPPPPTGDLLKAPAPASAKEVEVESSPAADDSAKQDSTPKVRHLPPEIEDRSKAPSKADEALNEAMEDSAPAVLSSSPPPADDEASKQDSTLVVRLLSPATEDRSKAPAKADEASKAAAEDSAPAVLSSSPPPADDEASNQDSTPAVRLLSPTTEDRYKESAKADEASKEDAEDSAPAALSSSPPKVDEHGEGSKAPEAPAAEAPKADLTLVVRLPPPGTGECSKAPAKATGEDSTQLGELLLKLKEVEKREQEALSLLEYAEKRECEASKRMTDAALLLERAMHKDQVV